MPRLSQFATMALTAISVLAVSTLNAGATCTRLGFTVNDYGKEGPTNDAKRLLDGYIAKWAGEHQIAKYNTGTKDVTCELFLNFIVFDEHTCRAEATVCWDGPAVAGSPATAAASPDKPVTGGTTKKTATSILPAKVKQAAKSPDAAAPAAPIETGALATAPAADAPVVVPPTPATNVVATPPAPSVKAAAAPSSQTGIADQALAAAKKAADAADRAAAAADRAAAAAAAANGKTAVAPQ